MGNNGKYRDVINGGVDNKNNSLKSDYWNEITNLFNAATGNNYVKKQLRDMYGKINRYNKHSCRVERRKKRRPLAGSATIRRHAYKMEVGCRQIGYRSI